MKHKRAMAEMQQMWEKAIRDHQHEYDSDEEVDQMAGTWEHRLRKMEMEKTRGKARFCYTSSCRCFIISSHQGKVTVAVCFLFFFKTVLSVLFQSGQNPWQKWAKGNTLLVTSCLLRSWISSWRPSRRSRSVSLWIHLFPSLIWKECADVPAVGLPLSINLSFRDERSELM